MARVLAIILGLIGSLCGAGTLNLTCVWMPCADRSAATTRGACGDGADADHGGCCCSEKPAAPATPKPARHEAPAKGCPCLSWTSAPPSMFEPNTAGTLVHRAGSAGAFLLLEAAPHREICVAAATPRARPPGARDTSTRVQAWHCVWTI